MSDNDKRPAAIKQADQLRAARAANLPLLRRMGNEA
jgi:hypothetical protein